MSLGNNEGFKRVLGSIKEITSIGGTIAITDPLGQITNLEVNPTGVIQIIAGTGVTISPVGGTGTVTVNASGGGGTPSPLYTERMAIAGSVNIACLIAAVFSIDPVALSGSANATLTGISELVAAAGVVVNNFEWRVDFVDTTHDQFDLSATVYVVNQTATQIGRLIGAGSLPSVGPNQSGFIDWTTASFTNLVGTDLTFDSASAAISSTAGDTYTCLMTANGGWD